MPCSFFTLPEPVSAKRSTALLMRRFLVQRGEIVERLLAPLNLLHAETLIQAQAVHGFGMAKAIYHDSHRRCGCAKIFRPFGPG